MEEQTLHYYLKVLNIALIIFLLLVSAYIFYILNKNLITNKNKLIIKKGDKLEYVLSANINNLSLIDINLAKIYFKISNYFKDNFIHYGEFNIENEITLISLLELISSPSNVMDKITIVEGWSIKQLDYELSKHYNQFYSIQYKNLIADTYFIQKNSTFDSLLSKLANFKNNYFAKHQNNKLFKNFNQDEIMIIGSLLEKEGLDLNDKKKISSVILNRLEKNMKLQIDATVLFAITNGNYNLQRKLLLSDLKFDHPYNTYLYKGLPPHPISYVGRKTLDVLFENYETDFLFYFFNKSLNKHIFSKTYKEHIRKLNEYRKK